MTPLAAARAAAALAAFSLVAACGEKDDAAQPDAAAPEAALDEAPAGDTADIPADIAERFPDYRPKTTPDELFDYYPGLLLVIGETPAERREDLGLLVIDLLESRIAAKAHPGEWRDGNVALGADPRQYYASPNEIIWAELGARVVEKIAETPAEEVRAALPDEEFLPLTYPVFHVRHVDVMGSGRFFYVSEPEIVEIEVEEE